MRPKYQALPLILLHALWRATLLSLKIALGMTLLLLVLGLAEKLSFGQSLNCTATKTVLPDNTSWWHVRVTITDGDKKTVKLYSIRPGDEFKKAIHDCEQVIANSHKRKK